MEIVEVVLEEAAAHTMRLSNAVGADSVTEISWGDLRTAEIGTRWYCSSGGEMFSASESATLVYRDEYRAVLLAEHDYSAERQEPESWRKLIGFAFREPAIIV